MREQELALILALRQEVAQVEEAEKYKAARTYVTRLVLGLSGGPRMASWAVRRLGCHLAATARGGWAFTRPWGKPRWVSDGGHGHELRH